MIKRVARWEEQLSDRGMAGVLVGLLVCFLACAALGLVFPRLALGAVGGILIGVSILFPQSSLLLLIMITPIQGIWGISRQEMPFIIALLIISINIKNYNIWIDTLKVKSIFDKKLILIKIMFMFLFVYSFYFLIGGLFYNKILSLNNFKELVFLFCVCGFAMIVSSYCAGPRREAFYRSAMCAVALSLVFTILVDVLAVYFSETALALRLIPSWQGVRLAGVHANPNATAKFLIAGQAFLLAAVWAAFVWDGSGPLRCSVRIKIALLLMAALGAVAIGATLSKASLLGMAGAPLLAALWLWGRSRRRAVFSAGSAVVVLGLALGYGAVLAGGLEKTVIQRGMHKPSPPELPRAAEKKSETPDLAARLASQFRLSQSVEMTVAPPVAGQAQRKREIPVDRSEMYRNFDGPIEYKTRECESVTCTGQRDRLWRAGLEIWKENWILGIGPGGWSEAYSAALQFPFDTPHNAVIEMGGGFGLPGLGIYALFVWCLLGQIRAAFLTSYADFTTAVYVRGAVLFAGAILITELVDPAKFFAMSPHTIWLWWLLAGLPPAGEEGA